MPEITSDISVLLLWSIIGYLLGSVPFGLLLSRLLGLGDLRRIGSGNIGATNVLRTGNKAAAAGTLLLDGGKGAVAVLMARALAGEDAAQIAGLASFVGHCFPVWLGFRGGKGVATFLGLTLAVAWPIGTLACATWLAAAAITRISSAGALSAALSAPFWSLATGGVEFVVLMALVAALVWWRHRSNIARIRSGTEPRIGAGKPG